MAPNPRNNHPHFARGPRNDAFKPVSNYPIGSWPEPTIQVRGDHWQSVTALQLGLQPRSFEELHTERMYLLEMLQQHDRRAFDLFMRVPLVEERILQSTDLEEQKRAKKHRGWLRHRIVDTVEEEKKILARLCELHVEIQCRERWWRVEKEREKMNLAPQHAPEYAISSFTASAPQPYSLPHDLHNLHHPYYMHGGTSCNYYEKPATAQDVYPDHSWDHKTPTQQSAPEYDIGFEGYELDDTAIYSPANSESHRRSHSLGVIVESRLTKRRSMPSLIHT